MRLMTASAIALFAMGGAALACPNANLSTGSLAYDASQIGAPQGFSMSAGGTFTLDQCGLGNLGYGQFRAAPDLTLDLTGMVGRELDLAATSDCDPAMLVQDARGQFYFNDDRDGLQPGMTLPAGAANGRVHVWLGTFSGGGCPAVFSIQALGNAQPVPQPIPQPTPQPVPQPVPTPIPVPQPVPQPVPPQANFCPTWEVPGPTLAFSSRDILQPLSYVAQATGGTDISTCEGVEGRRYASQVPQFTITLSEMEGYNLQLLANTDCDSTLLVNGADTSWHYNDDGQGQLMPQLDLTEQSVIAGRIDVWVGAYNDETCPGTFTIQALPIQASVQPQVVAPISPQVVTPITPQVVTPIVPIVAPNPVVVPVTPITPIVTPVGGCPSLAVQGSPITTDGEELYSPDRFAVRAAGGITPLSQCPDVIQSGGVAAGNGVIYAEPNYTFYLSGMETYGRLEIEVASDCDTTLLVNDARGNWHFDDDSGGASQPELNLTDTAALNGRVDVWVGTFGTTISCEAEIELETWNF